MTLEEKLAEQAKKGLLGLGFEQETAEEYAPWASMLAQFIPGVGEGVGIDNTVDAIQDERYGDAAIEGGLTLLGAVPIVGDMAAAAIKGIRRAPVPMKSRKKVADMTPEEHEAHKAYMREWHEKNNKNKNPSYTKRAPAVADDGWDEAAWIKGNPPPFPDLRTVDMSDDQYKAHRSWLSRKDYNKNKSRRLEKQARYAAENPEQIIANNRKQSPKRNSPEGRAKSRMYRGQRRAAELQRTPVWADPDRIDEIYRTAADVSAETGMPHHVDHVIPLQGKNVSGLHHQDNLLIVPGAENLSKGNRFEPGDLPPRAGVRRSRAYLKKIKAAQEAAKRK